jgi:UDP-N-acetylglucosamine:LPS N-acetylglucosamine transferase
MPTGRVLILSAGMGAGHDRVAYQLAQRLSAVRIEAEVIDVLDLLPLRLGAGLRHWYRWTMRNAPWVYAGIYRVFLASRWAPATSPLTVLAGVRLAGLVRRRTPSLLVSTFHVAAQVTGRLRAQGRLPVPSVVVVTDFAVHRLWLHPGNDAYLCPTPATARRVRAATGRPALCHAPLVAPEFRHDAAPAPGAMVLVSTGAWGVGQAERTARVLAGSGRYIPVVLCGRNERLRRRLHRVGGCVPLGWREDAADLMATAYALVDNTSGLTCKEALAAGLPVISYRPIPGHGRDGARAMARAGLSVHVRGAAGLLTALDRLGSPAERERRAARGRALFDHPAAETLLTDLLR